MPDIRKLPFVPIAAFCSLGGEIWVTTAGADGLEAVSRAVQKILSVVSALSPPEEIADWLRSVYRYAYIEQELSEQHKIITRVNDRDTPWQEQEIKLLCLNAAQYLQQSYRQSQATLLFSATLRPARYIFSQLGIEAGSPFFGLSSRECSCVLI
ncbi:hypothetical protein ACJJIF_04280 [Microbulbifer sp. SSSA002]|uniref:hypothetical protein n=1 Tax=Microbulbifer sp. SSSA002 TaxID=3243376 RepID=UPI0040391EBB